MPNTSDQRDLETKWRAQRARLQAEQRRAPHDAQADAFWRQNDAEVVRERAAKSRLVARVGPDDAARLIKAGEQVDRDLADARQIARLRRFGLAPNSKAIKAIELRMAARHCGVDV